MDTAKFEDQFDAIKEYDSKGYSSAGARHVGTALILIKFLIGRINDLETEVQLRDHDTETYNDCDTASNEVVCRNDPANLFENLDKILGIAKGLTTGSVGSSKDKIIGIIKEIKSKLE